MKQKNISLITILVILMTWQYIMFSTPIPFAAGNPFDCYGILSNETSVCQSHGTCVATNNCTCTTGYTGSQCDMPLCNGIQANETNVCQGHGNCTDYDTCQCETNYQGTFCDINSCNGTYSNETSVCNGHGSCVELDTCSCSANYMGSDCQITTCNGTYSNETNVCSAHGTCETYETCNCDTGYGNSYCETISCFGTLTTAGSVCSGNGNCTGPNTCSCETGYDIVANCSIWSCFGTNHYEHSVCSANGTCDSPDHCTCNSGYYGTSCDIPSCFGVLANESSVCSGRGDCIAKDTCSCSNPTEIGGLNCEQHYCYGILNNTASVCDGNGTCTSYNNCTCDSGYYGTDCTMYDCFNYPYNNAQTCGGSGQGLCIHPDNCQCVNDYEGSNCTTWSCNGVDKNLNESCESIHGTCLSPDVCSCPPNTGGQFCEIFSCHNHSKGSVDACGTHGTCTYQDNCDCQPGYSGIQCDYWECYGTYYNTSTVCSGKGTCSAPDTCDCTPGHTGVECQHWYCNGTYKNDTNGCNNHGECIGAETCQCYNGSYIGYDNITVLSRPTGWGSTYCEYFYCNGILQNEPLVCSGNGTCTAPDVCECNSTLNIIGDDCQNWQCHSPLSDSVQTWGGTQYFGGFEQDYEWYNQTDPRVCSGNGQCVAFNTCLCDSGATGESCQTWECYGYPQNDSTPCSAPNGTCTGPDRCTCHYGPTSQFSSGYTGDYCEDWLCYNVINTDSNTCSNHGDCLGPNNCECEEGYIYDHKNWQNCGGWRCFGIRKHLTTQVCTAGIGPRTGGVSYGSCISPDNCSCEANHGPGLDNYDACQYWECYGVNRSAIDSCAGNGTCYDHDQCSCFYGYEGNTCTYHTCNGTRFYDATVCSGNGTCDSVDNCTCNTGYFSRSNLTNEQKCETWECYGIDNKLPSVCDTHGACIYPNVCLCEYGYTGDNCDILICNGKNETDPTVCSGNGTCTNVDTCSCSTGWFGDDCQHHYCYGKANYASDACRGHGHCVTYNQCNCEPGYYTSDCRRWNCYGIADNNAGTCSSFGTCIFPDNCTCNEGHSDVDCSFWTCNGRNNSDTTACHAPNGTCASYQNCACETGYRGIDCEETVCYNFNHTDPNVCSTNGTCLSPDNCQCETGFIDPDCSSWRCNGIRYDNANVCSTNGSCVDPIIGCICETGYTGTDCEIFICYGKNATDPTVCTNTNGVCGDVDRCDCPSNWGGDECQFHACNYIPYNDNSTCSGNGQCVSGDNCSCNTYSNFVGESITLNETYLGYTGDNCEYPICFGKPSNDPNVCSNRGECVSHSNCTCEAGYIGSDCEYTVCYDYPSYHNETCSGHGVCSDINSCTCTPGWTFEKCQHAICYGIVANDSSVCTNGQGECIAPDTCKCNANWSGTFCNIPVCFDYPANDGRVCSNSHGTCTDPGLCICSSGYVGPNCEVNICYSQFSNETACSMRGNCSDHDNCDCLEGYTGYECQYPICNNTANNETNVCSSHGNCTSHEVCTCDEGYHGKYCEVPRCYGLLANDSTVCHGHGECILYDTCVCESTYSRDNCSLWHCAGVNHELPNACSGVGICNETNNCNCHTDCADGICHVGDHCQYAICWGNPASEENVCSGHGDCFTPDNCTCYDTHQGYDCQFPVCFDYNSTHPQVCSTHGECTLPDNCLCEPEYTGPNCQYPICFNVPSNDSTTCSGHGSCIAPDTCVCAPEPDWTGPNCQYPICNVTASNESSVCSAHGECKSPHTCACEVGYMSQFCETPICYGKYTTPDEPNPYVCTNGTCILYDTCVCDKDYTGDDCRYPVCHGYASNDPRVCTFGNGTCYAPNQCNCRPGKIGNNCQFNPDDRPIAHLTVPGVVSTDCGDLIIDGSRSYSKTQGKLSYKYYVYDKSMNNITYAEVYLTNYTDVTALIPSSILKQMYDDNHHEIIVGLMVQSQNEARSIIVYNTVQLLSSTATIPQVVIDGKSTYSMPRFNDLTIKTKVFEYACGKGLIPSTNIQYKWNQVQGPAITLSNVNSANLFIPKFTFEATEDTYIFNVNATNTDGQSSSTQVKIQITRSDIVSLIDGGDRSLPQHYILYLDGSRSYDPDNNVHAVQTYSWSCATCGYLFSINKPIQTIPSNSLPIGTHNINLLYQVGDRSNTDTVSITVFKNATVTPSVRVKRHVIVNENEPLLLEASLENYDSSTITPQWSIINQIAPINELTGLSENMPLLNLVPNTMITRNRANNRLSLAFKGGILYPGGSYIFRISLTTDIYAETTVYVNPKPKFGSLQFSPAIGSEFETTFEAIAPEWVDNNPTVPLQYAFILYRNVDASNPLIYIKDYSISNSVQFKVPIAGQHTLCVKIRDNYNATATECTAIQVNKASTMINSTYLNTLVTSATTLNDLKMVSAYIQENPASNSTLEQVKTIKKSILNKALSSTDSSANPTELISIIHDTLNDTASSDSAAAGIANEVLDKLYCENIDMTSEYIEDSMFINTLSAFNSIVDLKVKSLVDQLTDDVYPMVNSETEIQNLTQWHTKILSCFAKSISSKLINGETQQTYTSDYYDLTVYKDRVKEIRVDATSQIYGGSYSRLQVSPEITTSNISSDLEPLTLVNIRYKFSSNYNNSIIPGLVSEVYFINEAGEHQQVQNLPTPNTLNFYLPSWNATNALKQNVDTQLKCVFFNETSQEWSSEGCDVPEVLGTDSVTCRCTHTTLFALANLPTTGQTQETGFTLAESFFWIIISVTSTGTAFIVCNACLLLCCCFIYQLRRRHRKKESKHQTSLIVKEFRSHKFKLFKKKFGSKDYTHKYSSGLSNFDGFLQDNHVQSEKLSPLELKNMELEYQHQKMAELHKHIEILLEEKQSLNKKVLENDKLIKLNRSISRKKSHLQTNDTDDEILSPSSVNSTTPFIEDTPDTPTTKKSSKDIRKELLANYELYRESLREQQALQEKIKREQKNALRRENLVESRKIRVTELKEDAKGEYKSLTDGQDRLIELRKKKGELVKFLRITASATKEVEKKVLTFGNVTTKKTTNDDEMVDDEEIEALREKVHRYKRIAVALKRRKEKQQSAS